jgi:hypothetical protein
MTKDQYLEMCNQTEQEIDWEKCPPDWEDFPTIVIDGMNIFHSMGDRMYPDIGYVGKDYTNFQFLLQQYSIEEHQKDYTFDLILWLDSRKIEASQKRLKAEYDKIKRKG